LLLYSLEPSKNLIQYSISCHLFWEAEPSKPSFTIPTKNSYNPDGFQRSYLEELNYNFFIAKGDRDDAQQTD